LLSRNPIFVLRDAVSGSLIFRDSSEWAQFSVPMGVFLRARRRIQ
jgi:hypothetical protein